MSMMVTDSAVPNHRKISHEEGDNNGVLSRTISKSKVYPLEESIHSGLNSGILMFQILL